MKTFYYDYDRGYFITAAGGVIALTPTLVYGEQADWQFVLKTATGDPYSLAGIARWTAAVGTGTATLAGTAEGVTADPNAGTVAVPLDCDTPAFAAAVAGQINGIYGWFELAGYSATEEKIFYIRFAVALTPVVNSGAVPSFADRVIAVVDSGGYVTSDGVQTIASGAAQTAASSAVSGAIFSGQEFDTVIGSTRITATSGGVLVSAGGLVTSIGSGAIVASGADGVQLQVASGVIFAGYSDNYDSKYIRLGQTEATIVASGLGGGLRVYTDGTMEVNSLPVLTALATSTDSEATSASFDELAGGTSYVYTQPLTSIGIADIASDCRAEFDFTAGAGFDLSLPASAKRFGVSSYDSGSHYLIAVNGARVVVNEYTTGA